jgi:hypothetical protein
MKTIQKDGFCLLTVCWGEPGLLRKQEWFEDQSHAQKFTSSMAAERKPKAYPSHPHQAQAF